MISICFPDNKTREYAVGITGYEIAESISKSLAKKAIIIEINGELWDLSRAIENDSSIKIITIDDGEALDIIRHDSAHVLAQAIKEIYNNDVQITIGPVIDNGFYYDIHMEKKLSLDDLSVLEEKMKEISEKDHKIVREVWDRDAAIELFKSMGELYKAEIISSIPQGENITLYRQGYFIDLCRGPHAPSTKFVKYFKLMKLAGAYWRGDSNNEMLQRIYGTAWCTKKDLDNYLHMLQEAEKRDHRKLGKILDLFHIQDAARGQVFWHHKGWKLYTIIQDYMRNKLEENGYKEVNTPMMVDRKLWENSGHWDKFRENMFISQIDNDDIGQEVIAIKPMNCPCHVQIFNDKIRSYRDLPLRMAEFGSCHRNESSGSLHGLMRVRGFVQDDAHIFCEEKDINSETVEFCRLLKEIYEDFGFVEIKVKFSDRPAVRAGEDSVWDKAENALLEAVKVAEVEVEINKGEGAFYGPKLEFVLRDAIGRDWQCGTLQVDFVLPERLGAYYVAEDGSKRHPVMMHRAILGTFERFIGILIEEYSGHFPIWLAPIQVVITVITNECDEYAQKVYDKLVASGFRIDIDLSSEKISYKIKKYSDLKIPQIWVIGKQEVVNNAIAVRKFGSMKNDVMSLDKAISILQDDRTCKR